MCKNNNNFGKYKDYEEKKQGIRCRVKDSTIKNRMAYCQSFGFTKVGATGFEPATTWSQTRSATGLRYTPWNVRYTGSVEYAHLNFDCKGISFLLYHQENFFFFLKVSACPFCSCQDVNKTRYTPRGVVGGFRVSVFQYTDRCSKRYLKK